MPTLTDVFAKYADTYQQRFGARMPAAHRRVLARVRDCGTGRLGAVEYRCAQCGCVHATAKSCDDRHCPTCQTAANGDWCRKQTAKLLCCEYFLVTFTLPACWRAFARRQQRVCYPALFAAAAAALKTVLADPKFCGAEQVGFTSVLHTFGRDLNYHPHIHVIVPGGGLARAADGGWVWKPARPGFLAPVKVLSKLYRAEFQRQLEQAGHASHIPAARFRAAFVVDVQPAGDGAAALKYLSRYVSRTAISNSRLRSIDDGHVSFRYRKTGSRRDRTITLTAMEFIRRFLQHVLPAGLQKIRHYGFHSRRARLSLDEVRIAVCEHLAADDADWELAPWRPPALPPREPREFRCPHCGGRLKFRSVIRPPPRERGSR